MTLITGIIMADLAIDYRAEIHFGQQFSIEIALDEFSKKLRYALPNILKIIRPASSLPTAYMLGTASVIPSPEIHIRSTYNFYPALILPQFGIWHSYYY